MRPLVKICLSIGIAAAIAAAAGAPRTARGAGSDPAGQATARTVEIHVTSKGFEPAVVHVKKGEKVNLVVTRTTDRTCATAFVMRAKKLHVELPLDKPVTIPIQASEPGELDYACPMNMVRGKIVVQP